MPDPLPPVCILAGGLGTRLGDLVAKTPKAAYRGRRRAVPHPSAATPRRVMAPNRSVICAGHLGERIEERIGVEQFGVRIGYSYDGPQLAGTLGAIRRALPLLPDRFLVLYGDTYLRLDYRAAVAAWAAERPHRSHDGLRERWAMGYLERRLPRRSRNRRTTRLAPTPDMRWIDYRARRPGGSRARARGSGRARSFGPAPAARRRPVNCVATRSSTASTRSGHQAGLAETDTFLKADATKLRPP